MARLALALAALILVAAPVLAWNLVPTLVAVDGRVERIEVPTDVPHHSAHVWRTRFELPVTGLAYALEASLPVQVAGRPGAEPTPLAVSLDFLVNGEPVARQMLDDPGDGRARSLPGIVTVSGRVLRAGEDMVEARVVVSSPGGSLMPGWWTLEAGPLTARVGPR